MLSARLFSVQTQVVPTYATWNPADKAASITLSGGNLIATLTTTPAAVRSTIGKSSGKWYWEIKVSVSHASVVNGVATSSASLATYCGGDAFGWGYACDGTSYNNAIPNNLYGAAWVNGDIIGVALDMGAGTITFYKNNISQGIAYSGLTGIVFAMASSNGIATAYTANFGATAFQYTPPPGFNAGLYQ
jgi:hypothetical protein